jgi:integrase/recombinase XerD
VNLWNLTEQLIRERMHVKGVTPATVNWYRHSFNAFRPALDCEFVSVRQTRQSVISRIGELQSERRGNKAVSINTYLRCIKAFLNWASAEGLVSEPFRLEWLKEEKKVITGFSEAQVRALISWKPRTFGEHRLYAFSSLILDTGLRVSEALGLTRDHVDMEGLLITVSGKGRKERTVPISFEMRRVLHRWSCSHQFPLMFPTTEGAHQTQRNVLRGFKVVGKQLGIKGVRVSFHTLRHTFALNYIRNGGDVFRLQRILGHSTLEMTRRYVNLQTEDLSAVHNKLSTFAQSVR